MYKVAVVQFAPKLMDVEHNLAKMLAMIGQCKADLVVLPELITTGYVFRNADEIIPLAESIPSGVAFRAIRELAMKTDVSVVYGFAEKDGNKLYNSSVLINPNGDFMVYRKIHLFMREKLLFSPGDKGFFVSEAKGGVKVGMMICFDWQFPEAARSLALKGAQIICHPSNLVLPWCQQAMLTRSLENRVFSITANRIGHEKNGDLEETFTGRSQIIGKQGSILARLTEDEEDLAVVEIEPMLANDKKITDLNDAFRDRRPEFYTYC